MSENTGNIFEAAAAGNIAYIQKNTRQLGLANERGWTALHFAARYGQLETARIIKESGGDLNITNSEGKTASEVASFWGNDEIAKLLAPAKVESVTETVGTSSPYPDNYSAVFAGNPLNRYGWNRGNPEFLSKLAKSEKSNYIVMNGLKALYTSEGNIHYVKYNHVSSIVDSVYTSNGVKENITDIILIFLGVDESEGLGENGTAYWALDLTPRGVHQTEFNKLIKGFESNALEFEPTLPRAFIMDKNISSILAQAAAMIDWNTRNKFCSACGKLTILEEAGYKRSCILDVSSEEEKCISHKGVQNFAYPRTDAVVIVCIVHPNGDKILLGRNKRWPKKMFSCISGFVEAAETLEEAVRREAFEETGIIVDRVAYHSSQPWPFPNSLMLGFIAEASSTEIDTTYDQELEAAVWYSRSEVVAALKNETGALFSMAPKGSLASTLVHSWVNDKKWQSANAKM